MKERDGRTPAELKRLAEQVFGMGMGACEMAKAELKMELERGTTGFSNMVGKLLSDACKRHGFDPAHALASTIHAIVDSDPETMESFKRFGEQFASRACINITRSGVSVKYERPGEAMMDQIANDMSVEKVKVDLDENANKPENSLH